MYPYLKVTQWWSGRRGVNDCSPSHKRGWVFLWMNEQGDKHGARLCSRAYMREWKRETGERKSRSKLVKTHQVTTASYVWRATQNILHQQVNEEHKIFNEVQKMACDTVFNSA